MLQWPSSWSSGLQAHPSNLFFMLWSGPALKIIRQSYHSPQSCSSQPRGDFAHCPQAHLAMSGNTLGCQNHRGQGVGTPGISCTETREAANYPTMHRKAPKINYPAQNLIEVKKTCFSPWLPTDFRTELSFLSEMLEAFTCRPGCQADRSPQLHTLTTLNNPKFPPPCRVHTGSSA